MNRVTRDYCSKKYHPKWKAWEAEYNFRSTSAHHWSFVRVFCVYCRTTLENNSGYIGYTQNKKLP